MLGTLILGFENKVHLFNENAGAKINFFATDDRFANYRKVLKLTLVNILITITFEFIVRTTLMVITQAADIGFFVGDISGAWRIHKQVLINIMMTLFASLLGAPALFVKSRRFRLLYFVGFALINSLISQLVVGVLLSQFVWADFKRLYFDILYALSIKFWVFELGRPLLVEKGCSILGLGKVRLAQDFTTTTVKVVLLKIFSLGA